MSRRGTPESKWCQVCGRTIQWRKKWERDWDEVKYCSQSCRRAGITTVDRQLEQAITDLLSARAKGSSICPSEAARSVGDINGLPDEQWRDLMQPARSAARRMVVKGEVAITQKGVVVDPSTAKGPIRIRRS